MSAHDWLTAAVTCSLIAAFLRACAGPAPAVDVEAERERDIDRWVAGDYGTPREGTKP